MQGEFHTVCRSCQEENIAEDYTVAQDFFDQHIADGHVVVMVNLNETSRTADELLESRGGRNYWCDE